MNTGPGVSVYMGRGVSMGWIRKMGSLSGTGTLLLERLRLRPRLEQRLGGGGLGALFLPCPWSLMGWKRKGWR